MKVEVRYLRGGKKKLMDQRYADVLVKLGHVEYVDQQGVADLSFIPIITAPAVPMPVHVGDSGETEDDSDQNPNAVKPEAATSESENDFFLESKAMVADTEGGADQDRRKRGRPAKNKYLTKVMTAEE